jgi:anti-sigma-K factor RskA
MANELNHTEAEELIALAVLGVLPAADGAGLDAHLSVCAACRETAHAFTATAAVLPESLDLLEPPAALRRRLLSAVYVSPSAKRHSRGRLPALWRLVPQRRIFTAISAVAVAAAIVVGVWGATRSATPAGTKSFPVAATTAAPAVHGELIFYPATSSSVLTVSGLQLPPQSAGQQPLVVEVWLIPRAGVPQPAAFLAASPDGSTWSAVIRGNALAYQAIAATEEPIGGRPQPTGPQVFSVALTDAG